MRRLYFRIYLTVLGVGLLTVLAVALATRFVTGGADDVRAPVRRLAEYVASDLPLDGAALDATMAERGERLGLHLSLWSADRTLLAHFGPPMEAPDAGSRAGQWRHGQNGMGLLVHLEDGRWLAAEPSAPRHGEGVTHFLQTLGLIGFALAVACFPIARWLTRRLEALQRGVEGLASGDLGARVAVEGQDEVARLAMSFNDAAGRIESLVAAQKRVLASASHELRSPLARLRMAVALLDEPDVDVAGVVAGAERDIAELDELVGDLLLASSLDAGREQQRAPVDLLGLVAEEAARAGASLAGEPTTISGDEQTLRRMVRNLLENARRHAGGDVELTVGRQAQWARLVVADRGPGVRSAERERIFEPFYRPEGHREGTDGGVGLGLSLVREIARAHGGEARCVAREGGGTRFEVDLPIAEAAS